MIRSLIALSGPAKRLRQLAPRLRTFLLERPGLITNVLAVIAFFSIGIV